MADYFVTKTWLAEDQLLEIDSGFAIESYPALRSILTTRAGENTAKLFAEPLLSRGNDSSPPSVSWYCDDPGEPVQLGKLAGKSRRDAEARLSELLQRLRPLLSEPDIGPLIGAALFQTGADSIYVVNGQPVLINWGILPSTAFENKESRQSHFNKTLGRFLPLANPPPIAPADVANHQSAFRPEAPEVPEVPEATVVPEVREEIAPDNDENTESGKVNTIPTARSAAVRAAPNWFYWAPLIALIGISVIVLIWLLLPGTRLFPASQSSLVAATEDQSISIIRNNNRELEEQLLRLQFAMDGAQCHSDGTLLLPDKLSPGQFFRRVPPVYPAAPQIGSGETIPMRPDSLLPPLPKQIVPSANLGNPDIGDGMSLSDLIEQTTVIVVNYGLDDVVTGSGFFVAPNLIMTNDHVVAGSNRTIKVQGKSLGTARDAEIVNRSGSSESSFADFALLRINGVSNPYLNMRIPTGSLQFHNVYVAGFPGDVMDIDFEFERLMGGVDTAIPNVFTTAGIASKERTVGPNVEIIVHGATVSEGDSGGPLLDACGNVVGINTSLKEGEFRSLSVALPSKDIVRFMAESGYSVEVVRGDCAPTVRPPNESASLQSDQAISDGTGNPEEN